MMCCRNVTIDNVFMRNSDDCAALYNHRWDWRGGSSDITVKNSVLWADIAHPINIGGHGDADNAQGEVIERLRFPTSTSSSTTRTTRHTAERCALSWATTTSHAT